ncbi:hypothetical protein H5410_021777 [Solanum commersonii]|uniref:Uncharacterized protein n=1 Tax=Solanum commersonii TaxID=4109 RepID=A0A9J5ZF84_SOLCO|nr:hypothetical protein H5410_021777 [Solanum commersonii]
MLSYQGKEVFPSSVLQSILIYVLSTITPPNCVMKELHRIFAKFSWSNKEFGRSKHWSKWLNALYAKLWWRFQTKNNLWSNFLWNKYCKPQIPTLVLWKGGSQVWKHMLENRETIERHLWWAPRGGSSTI